MGARENILQAIKQNKPELVAAPIIAIETSTGNLVQQFVTTLENIGGKVCFVNSMEAVKIELQSSMSQEGYIVNTIASLGAINAEINNATNAFALEPVYKAYIQGHLAVAENGSVWLDEKTIINRLLPFICQHLVLVIHADSIVANMHEAYKQIKIDAAGYGVFLAGPSKTADIEQSLVIGAHGARSLVVYLIQP